MKKVICINNKKGSSDTDYIPLTIGKEYDAYLLFLGPYIYYRIIDDTRDIYSYSTDRKQKSKAGSAFLKKMLSGYEVS